jgi:MFS superfamily sulfate permease-like transporter
LKTNCKYFFNRIPPPVVPPMAAISDVLGDAVAIAIVCFVINISMAKLFATKYKYQISPNQVIDKKRRLEI